MWDFYDPEQPSGEPPRPELDGCAKALLYGLIVVGILSVFMSFALAHEIPMHDHTTYPPSCCNSAADSPTGDCAPIDDQYVHQGVDGYHISLPVGSHPKLIHKGYEGVVPYKDVKEPLDGRYHICLTTDGAYRYCFFPKPGTS